MASSDRSTSKSFFYAEEGERRGPVTADELRELAASGKLARSDMVWQEGVEKGVPASRVKGLFTTATPAAGGPIGAPSTEPNPHRAKPAMRFPPPLTQRRLFLSCVSHEFRHYRDVLAEKLAQPAVEIRRQEDFINAGRTTLEKLNDYIATCDAVIHLVGHASGAYPEQVEADTLLNLLPDFASKLAIGELLKSPGLSYTQWEAWLALYHAKPLALYKAADVAHREAGFSPDAAQNKRQQLHWKRLESLGRDRKEFVSPQDLSIEVLRALPMLVPGYTDNVRRGEFRDRNLLFAVMAMQDDILSREQFVQACKLWAEDLSRPISDVIAELGWLPADDRQLIEARLERKLKGRGGDARQSLAECMGGTARQSLSEALDPEMFASLPDRFASFRGVESQPGRWRYRLTRTHGMGGLGVVSIAEDAALERNVAVKHMRLERLLDPMAIERFIREARLTGRLQHPNIVPVYELGLRPDDQTPFYAMRFVGHRTLHDAIAEHHSDNSASESERNLRFRGLLQSFLSVCNAVAFAHDERVIHRDIKPANVMIGDFGEVILLDWGLAKRLDEPEPAAAAAAGLDGETGTSAAQTLAGVRLGSPAYMAPEQASGRIDLHGTQTDVYGLGVMLYEILSGDVPFSGASTEELLAAIQSREMPDPRMRNRSAPRALIAICRKAMEKGPLDRYPNAKALAEDVQHWLADEPVSVFREPAHRRCARWARNHKPIAAAIAASIAVLAVGGAVASAVARHAQNVARANGLVESLMNAHVRRVPEILQQVNDDFAWTKPALHAKLEMVKDGTDARLRLALALVDREPPQVDYLYDQMLDADAETLVLIRDTLKDHVTPARVAAMSERLWELLELKGTEIEADQSRLCAAAALARFDPSSGRWGANAPVIALKLVALNPVEIASWKEALRPAGASLVAPLHAIFADPSRNKLEVTQAAALVADYARGDPRALANALIDGDESDFGVFFPLLKAHGAAAIAELDAVLARKLDPPWSDPPLDPAWTVPSESTKNAIASAHGILGERFAFCQDFAWPQFGKLAEELRKSGYRPTRVRPWTQRGAPFVAAIWTRDGKPWELEMDVPRKKIPLADAPAVRDGLLPADVAIAPVGEVGQRFVLLWGPPESSDEVRRIAIDAHEEELVKIRNALRNSGSATQLASGVWTDSGRSRHYMAILSNKGAASDFRAAYPGFERVDRPQWDIAVAPAIRPQDPLDKHRELLASIAKRPRREIDGPKVRSDRARAYYHLGQLQEALSDFEFLNKHGGVPKEGLPLLAWTLARRGNEREALATLERYVESEEAPLLREHAAVVLAGWLGRFDDAAARIDALVANANFHGAFFFAASAASQVSEACEVLQAERGDFFRNRAVELLEESARRDADQCSATFYADTDDLAALHKDARFLALLDRLNDASIYSAVWRTDAMVESRLLGPLSPEECLSESRGLAAQGYRPFAIASAEFGHISLGIGPALSTVWHRPLSPQSAKDQLARQQASAAVAIFRLGKVDQLWRLLTEQPDPSLRSHLIDRLRWLDREAAAALAARFGAETDVSRRRALLLALDASTLPDKERGDFVRELERLYTDDPDPGIHSAAERRVGWHDESPDPVRSTVATGKPEGGRHWYLTRMDRQTMVVIRPTQEFLMGSPLSEADRLNGGDVDVENRHRRFIGASFGFADSSVRRVYAIAANEVTRSQFYKFRPKHEFEVTAYQDPQNPTTEELGPANMVTWYDAAAYCNWFSEQEGIARDQWVYEIDADSGEVRMPFDYLDRTGYRLPTEAEWEYACRAGSTTARHFGESDTLLSHYARYLENSKGLSFWPVGSLMPNEFGLFDMHGNATEWTQNVAWSDEPYSTKSAIIDDHEDDQLLFPLRPSDKLPRALRGGSFMSAAPFVRSAWRGYALPTTRSRFIGFRVARTLDAATADFLDMLEMADGLRQHAGGRPNELYRAACGYAVCVWLLDRPPSGSGSAPTEKKRALSPQEQATHAKYLKLALNMLEEAIAAGYNDAEMMSQDDDLEVLRELPEFKNMLDGITTKAGDKTDAT